MRNDDNFLIKLLLIYHLGLFFASSKRLGVFYVSLWRRVTLIISCFGKEKSLLLFVVSWILRCGHDTFGEFQERNSFRKREGMLFFCFKKWGNITRFGFLSHDERSVFFSLLRLHGCCLWYGGIIGHAHHLGLTPWYRRTFLCRSLEKVVLQSVIRRDSRLGIIIQHSQNEVLEFEIVRDGMTGFAQSSAAGASGFYADNVMHFT